MTRMSSIGTVAAGRVAVQKGVGCCMFRTNDLDKSERPWRNAGRASAAFLCRLAEDRSGVSAIVLGLSLSTVLGLSGLAVDAGLWYNDKRTVQGVADLAAWTAAQTYLAENATGSAATDATAAATATASANGLRSGVNGVTVTVNNPPKSGSYLGNGSAFEVVISKSENLFFSTRYLNAVTVTARAVSLYQTTTTGGGGPGCLNAMLPGPMSQIYVANGAQVNASACGMYANGSSSSAVDVQGGANVKVDYVHVVGGVTTGNGGSITNSGATVTNSSAAVDPYSGLTLNQIETSTGTTVNCSSYSMLNESSWQSTPYALSPGVYCGGVSVSNGNSLSLSPGIYYMVGGNLNIMSGTNVASGVTIVMVPANGVNPTLQIGNGANVTMSSMSTGPTAGITVYQDPSNATTMSICGSSGGGVITINGTLYAPGAQLSIANGCNINGKATASTECFEIIAGTINLQGGMGAALNSCSTYGVKTVGGSKTVTTIAMAE